MSIEVEIRGFQSIENVTLVLDGFTALVGRSNIGKSAVVRAIKTALTNSLGTSFVRHNAPECARSLRKAKSCRCQASVHIKTEGFDLLWEKGDAVNRYRFNGQDYDKPGQGIPEFLISSGFGTVKVGDDVGLIQVADQFFPIFMLNQSGPATAEAISDVARLDRINTATRMVDKDRREAVSTKKLREKDAQELRGRLGAYEDLDTAIAKVSSTATHLDQVQTQREKVTTLTQYAETTAALVGRIKAIWEVGSVVIPDVKPIQEGDAKLTALGRFITDLGRRVDNFKGVAWIEGFLKAVPDFEPVLETLKNHRLLGVWIDKLRSYRGRFVALDEIDKIKLGDVDKLTETHGQLKDLVKLTARYAAIETAITALEVELVSIVSEETALQNEVDDMGVCPTCTQPVSSARHAHA